MRKNQVNTMISRLARPKPKAQLEQDKKTAKYFATHCELVFSLLPFVRSDDRKILYKWLEKFRASSESEADRTNRNDYLWFMLIQMESGTVTYPFTGQPPKGPLIPLLQFMPKALYIKIMKAANRKLLDYEEAMKKVGVTKDPCPLPEPDPRKCILKKKKIDPNAPVDPNAPDPVVDPIPTPYCPLQKDCPQISKQTICPEEECERSPWSKPGFINPGTRPAVRYNKPPPMHPLHPGERRIPLYEAAIKKCRPSDFLSTQPKPKRGFLAYGSCFSDQMNMLV